MQLQLTQVEGGIAARGQKIMFFLQEVGVDPRGSDSKPPQMFFLLRRTQSCSPKFVFVEIPLGGGGVGGRTPPPDRIKSS